MVPFLTHLHILVDRLLIWAAVAAAAAVRPLAPPCAVGVGPVQLRLEEEDEDHDEEAHVGGDEGQVGGVVLGLLVTLVPGLDAGLDKHLLLGQRAAEGVLHLEEEDLNFTEPTKQLVSQNCPESFYEKCAKQTMVICDKFNFKKIMFQLCTKKGGLGI